MDIVSRDKRSQMMSEIRGSNTKPEIIVRRLLHGAGYRFRSHNKKLAGKPDIVLAKWKTVIFVHGCFWHGHENCELFRIPKTRPDFWQAKIEANRIRDSRNAEQLASEGWNIIIVWECAVTKKVRLSDEQLLEALIRAMQSPPSFREIRGIWD